MLYRTFMMMLALAMATPNLVAQEEIEYDELLILYVDGDYEKLIKKGEKYTDDSDTRRDPRPYLYISMAYFEMSQLEEYAEEYPKAFRDALKYASKFSRKDKEREYFSEHRDYIDELRSEAMREADLYMSDDDRRGMSKASRIYKYLVDIDPDDAGSVMMYSSMLYEINRRGEADLLMRELGPKLTDIDFDDMTADQQEMLKFGMMHYATYLKQEGMLDSARVTMNLGHPYFKDDNEFRLRYEEIQN